MTETTNGTQAENLVGESSQTAAADDARLIPEQSEASSAANDGEGHEQQATETSADDGDIAADYLEELLDIVDVDGDIEIEIRGDRTFISIQAEDGGDELEDLVGNKGEVLDALQELARLAVLTSTGNRTRLVLDINGHRQKRHGELKAIADDAAAQLAEHGEAVHLEPMSAFERKIVHDFVAEAGLNSESEGEGKRRHVVVSAP